MKHARFMGIDPGKSGAVCILGAHGEILDLIHMPTDYEILARLAQDFKMAGGRIGLESIEPNPAWANKSAWSFGKHVGVLEYLFSDAIKIPARTWQAAMTAGFPYRCPKHRALAYAQQRWPLQNWFSKRGKLYDGLIDAAVIAEYVRLMEK